MGGFSPDVGDRGDVRARLPLIVSRHVSARHRGARKG